MIHLVNVSKFYQTALGRKTVIRQVSLSLPTNRRIAVLGHNGAGKSTLMNLIAGVEEPSVGKVVVTSSVSWPLSSSGGIHADLTGHENAAFIARIYHADVDDTIRRVAEFSELGEYMKMAVRTYSQGMRARLAFAASMAIEFECYLIDEITAVGDARFAEKCRRALLERSSRSGFLYVSHNDAAVRRYCDSGIVIRDGYLVPFESLGDAIAFYHRTTPA